MGQNSKVGPWRVALDWMRDNSMLPGDLDDASISSFRSFGGPMIGGLHSKRRKPKELSSASSNRNPGEIDNASVASINTISGTKIESFAPKNDVAKALDWLRKNDQATADTPSIAVSTYSRASQSPGHRLSEAQQRAPRRLFISVIDEHRHPSKKAANKIVVAAGRCNNTHRCTAVAVLFRAL